MRIKTRLDNLESAAAQLPLDPVLFLQRMSRLSPPQKEVLLRELSDENLETLCQFIHQENPALATMSDEELEALITQAH